ncbi:MAG: REP element-mobilizing transposase RayT [Flammeovirgaceae bacterium]|jgi:REP element-mobilizing transposase RayT
MNKNRKSYRLQGWDYRNGGLYFITILTKNRAHYFGEIENEKLIYSACGAIANVLWAELAHRHKHISLGEFVVMPNHIHGIIQIDDVDGNVPTKDNANIILTTNADVENLFKNQQMSAISPKSGSISTIIRSYKSAVTKHCNRLDLDSGWHVRFHDHIIRNEKAFNIISEYIINNPKNWKEDRFY